MPNSGTYTGHNDRNKIINLYFVSPSRVQDLFDLWFFKISRSLNSFSSLNISRKSIGDRLMHGLIRFPF